VESLFYGNYPQPLWDILAKEVENYDVATLGTIAASGRGAWSYHGPGKMLIDVQDPELTPGFSWVDPRYNGRQVLFTTALLALICRMSDLCAGIVPDLDKDLEYLRDK